MAAEFNLENDIRVSALSRYPEVFSMEEQTIDEEEIWKVLVKALRGAAQDFVASRITEGRNLAEDLIEKLNLMLDHVSFIEERSPLIIEEYSTRLREIGRASCRERV